MSCILAGLAMNIFLAFAIYTGVAAIVGAPRLATTQVDSVEASMLPAGAEQLAALRHGEQIVRVNRDSVRTWQDLVDRVLAAPPETRIEVAGRPEPIAIHLAPPDTGARAAVGPALPTPQ